MKNFIKITVLAAITLFIALSCAAPGIEFTDFDWTTANAENDPSRNSGLNASGVIPTVGITETTTAVGNTDTITGFKIKITFPKNADVLRSEITAASLDFITFHTYTNATTVLKEDSLSNALSFTLENRIKDVVTVKLTANINTANAFSDLVMKIDAKKYTYNHGLRYDVDSNGKIEDIYDDFIFVTNGGANYLQVSGSGTKAGAFTAPGQVIDNETAVTLENFPAITLEGPGTINTTVANDFRFAGVVTKTNSNTLFVASIGYNTGGDAEAAAWNTYYKDIGDTLAKGIKLQKYTNSDWAEEGTAVYVGQNTDDTSIQGSIVIRNVSFEHLATYRLIWTGDAYTQTSNTYYGVNQRLYITNGYDPYNPNPIYPDPLAKRFTRTQIPGDIQTIVNGNSIAFVDNTQFKISVEVSLDSYDSAGKNNVLKVVLPDGGSVADQYFWNKIDKDVFKKSFKLAYSYSNALDSSIISGDIVYIDIVDIDFQARDWANPTSGPLGTNVLLITLDPNFKLPLNSVIGGGLNFTGNISQAFNAYRVYASVMDQWQVDYAEWEEKRDQYNNARLEAYDQFISDNQEYSYWENISHPAWEALEPGLLNPADPDYLDKDDPGYTSEQGYIDWLAAEPQAPFSSSPVLQDYYDIAEAQFPNPGTAPTQPSGGSPKRHKSLYFVIDKGISVSNKDNPVETQFFGSANSGSIFDFVEFYGPF